MSKVSTETHCNYCGRTIMPNNGRYVHIAGMDFCDDGCHAGYIYIHSIKGV